LLESAPKVHEVHDHLQKHIFIDSIIQYESAQSARKVHANQISKTLATRALHSESVQSVQSATGSNILIYE
jgi:hypothetical protein